MKSLIRLFFVLLLLSSAQAYADEPTAKVIKLRYQTAEQLMPLLRDAMGDRMHIVGRGDTLIVRGNVRELQELRRLLRQIDKLPASLKITVKRAQEGLSTRQADVYRTEQQQEEANVQSVTVLSGHVAFVSLTKTRMVVESVYNNGDGLGSGADLAPQERRTGLYVQARLVGNEVILKVTTEKENLSRFGLSDLRSSELITTITAPLGQWVKLGGSTHEAQHREQSRVYRTEDSALQNTVYVRVDKR